MLLKNQHGDYLSIITNSELISKQLSSFDTKRQ